VHYLFTSYPYSQAMWQVVLAPLTVRKSERKKYFLDLDNYLWCSWLLIRIIYILFLLFHQAITKTMAHKTMDTRCRLTAREKPLSSSSLNSFLEISQDSWPKHRLSSTPSQPSSLLADDPSWPSSSSSSGNTFLDPTTSTLP